MERVTQGDFRQVSEIMDQSLAPATHEQRQIKNLDLPERSFLEAISRPRIRESSLEDVDKLFRSIFTLIGLKGQNYPNDFETLVLYQYLQENYAEHTTEEVFLAFKLAIQGSLKISIEDVKCYENFSCLYLSIIMTKYRQWASDTYRQLEPIITKPQDEQKYLEGPRKQIHWGYYIDQAYTHFLSFEDENWRKFPVEFYNQLVLDGYIEENFFRSLMPVIREKELKELYHEQHRLSNGSTIGMKDDRKDMAESIKRTNLFEIEKKIKEYKEGKKDGELEVLSKKRSVIKLFVLFKKESKEHIYEPVTE